MVEKNQRRLTANPKNLKFLARLTKRPPWIIRGENFLMTAYIFSPHFRTIRTRGLDEFTLKTCVLNLTS